MSRWLKYTLIAIAFILGIFIYGNNDPASSGWFPRCAFLNLTGLQCPGCGSQRCLHALLNLDIITAFRMNPLVVMAIPFLLGAVLTEHTRLGVEYPKLYRFFHSAWTIRIIFVLIVVYWIGRNL